jgi:hypothetical protein
MHNASSMQGSNHLAKINSSNKERRRSLPEVALFTSASLKNEVETVLLPEDIRLLLTATVRQGKF